MQTKISLSASLPPLELVILAVGNTEKVPHRDEQNYLDNLLYLSLIKLTKFILILSSHFSWFFQLEGIYVCKFSPD